MFELKCSCGNAARYIDDHGEFSCGICPIKKGRDSIRIGDVPELLRLTRIVTSSLSTHDIVHVVNSIRSILGKNAAERDTNRA